MELESAMNTRLEDKDFFEWMIDKLNRDQLALLLFASNIKQNANAISKLHKGFIRNKLLLKQTRVKLKNQKILPPFPFLVGRAHEEFTKEELLTIAKDNDCKKSEIALLLFLQNHYSEALKLYDDYMTVNTVLDPDKNSKEAVVIFKESVDEGMQPKIQKKLQQKIVILTQEKEELMEQLRKLKNDNKEKNRQHQKELNELKQELALEKNRASHFEEELKHTHILLEKEKDKHTKLIQLSEKEDSSKKMVKKVALIGDPKNSSIIVKEMFTVVVYELDTIGDFLAVSETYDYIFYLSYTIDDVIYEEAIPADVRQRITRIDNFATLKKLMGALRHE